MPPSPDRPVDTPAPPETVRRVVLVGFMAAGKSTVGRALARRLGWRFVDLDERIERRAGRGVARIFAEEGEPAFRALEAATTAELAGLERTVIAPGGGWLTGRARLEALGPGTLSVWLRVSAEAALARSRAGGGERPLLAVPDPLTTIRRLLEEREPLYRLASLAVPTDGRDPEAVARDIEATILAGGPRRRP